MNGKKIKITILTATYNSEKTIRQTIKSVLSQSYPYIEYIIIDGKSKDKTTTILKEFDGRIKWISEEDNGLYDALNKGIMMATGDYIEIIGSDDALCHKDVIKNVVKKIHSDTDILSCQEWGVTRFNRQFILSNQHARDKKKYNGGMVPHGAMFVRRSLLRLKLFDTKYKIAADYKFFLECYFDEKIKFQYEDDLILFFAISGASSNVEKCFYENKNIHEQLNLPYAPFYNNDGFFKRKIKGALCPSKTYFFAKKNIDRLKLIYYNFFVWEKHSCKNEICRWCGRS